MERQTDFTLFGILDNFKQLLKTGSLENAIQDFLLA